MLKENHENLVLQYHFCNLTDRQNNKVSHLLHGKSSQKSIYESLKNWKLITVL